MNVFCYLNNIKTKIRQTNRQTTEKNANQKRTDTNKSQILNLKQLKKQRDEAEMAAIHAEVCNELGPKVTPKEIRNEVSRRLRIKYTEKSQDMTNTEPTKKQTNERPEVNEDILDITEGKEGENNQGEYGKREESQIQTQKTDDLKLNKDKSKNKPNSNIKNSNDELEQKYKRKYYTVILKGPGIIEYRHDIHRRINELERCTGIINPSLI